MLMIINKIILPLNKLLIKLYGTFSENMVFFFKYFKYFICFYILGNLTKAETEDNVNACPIRPKKSKPEPEKEIITNEELEEAWKKKKLEWNNNIEDDVPICSLRPKKISIDDYESLKFYKNYEAKINNERQHMLQSAKNLKNTPGFENEDMQALLEWVEDVLTWRISDLHNSVTRFEQAFYNHKFKQWKQLANLIGQVESHTYLNSLKTVWILPEFIILIIILFLIITYIFFLASKKTYFISFYNKSIKFSLFVLFITLSYLNINMWYNRNTYNYKTYLDFNFFSLNIKLIICIFSFFIIGFIKSWFLKQNQFIIEYYILYFGCLFFFYLLISSTNLFLSYLCFEGAYFQIFLLMILNFRIITVKLILKFFFLSSITSSLFLYAVSLFYGIYGTLNYTQLKNQISYFSYLTYGKENFIYNELLTKWAILLIMLSLIFKIGCFPFHIWVPSVYTYSPNPTTVIISTISKFIMVIFLIKLCCNIFYECSNILKFFFFIVGLGSLIIGTIGSLWENNIKKFFAYSSINQMGFLFLDLSCFTNKSFRSSFIFLFIYIITTLGFWNFIFNIKEINKEKYNVIYFSDLKKYYNNNGILTLIFSTYIISYAGLPIFAGFFGKFNIYYDFYLGGHYFLLIFVLIFNVLNTFYYFRIIKLIWFENLIKNTFKNINNNNIEFLNLFSVKILCFFTLFFNIFFLFFYNYFYSYINYLILSMLYI